MPTWLPAYSAEQLKLLAPSGQPIKVPARPTYPDPTAFRYGRDLELDDPRDAVSATKIVADIVTQSDRTYTVVEIRDELANSIAQYGPPPDPEPDAFSVARRKREGGLTLQPCDGADAAREIRDEALANLKSGKSAAAIESVKKALREYPEVPGLHIVLGQALLASRELGAAEAAFREALRIDPTLASAHAGLGAALMGGGDVIGARRSVAQALAYHPRYAPALALASHIADGEPQRPRPFEIFLEVDAEGAVRLGSQPTPAARMYAGCRAVMRYEPELRSILFGAGPRDPYVLSVQEEIFCNESAIGAFIASHAMEHDKGADGPADKQAGAILALAHTEGLLGYVMFEILGAHRPEHARLAPGFVHRAMVAYVQRHVLGYDPGPDLTPYMASTDPL